MKQKFWIILTVAMLVVILCCGLAPADEIASGNCGADGDNLTWTLDSDGMLTISGSGAMAAYDWDAPWFSSRFSITSIAIDSGVTSIGEYAFAGFSSMKNIQIPNSVTSIGNYAFTFCTDLINIILPENITRIEDHVFEFCTNLTSITIPVSIIDIGEDAFSNCSALSDIYYKGSIVQWESITKGSNNTPLTSARIHYDYDPSSGPVIISSGMCGNNLTWTLDSDGLFTISGTGNMTNYDDPYDEDGTIVPWNDYLQHIWKIVINSGATSIGEYAFINCANLTAVTIPAGVTDIGRNAFSGCFNLRSILIPGSVRTIGEYAFTSSGLTNITLQNGVASIGNSAFYECMHLTSVSLPDSLVEMKSNPFQECYELTEILVNSTNTNFKSVDGILYTYDGSTLVACPAGKTEAVILEGTKSIGEAAFHGCYKIPTLQLPNSLINISNYAFFNCEGPVQILIPDSVKSIGNHAFSCCYGLTNMIIPDSVTTLGRAVFWECWHLESVSLPSHITNIPYRLFDDCHSLQSITIPVSVTRIERRAFEECTSLTDVYYTGTQEQWKAITIAVDNDAVMANVHCSDGTAISHDCSGTLGEGVSYSLNNGVITISGAGPWSDSGAFQGNTNITCAKFENGVTEISDATFLNCGNLKTIFIPSSITKIEEWAFLGCTSLTDVYYTGTEEQWTAIIIGEEGNENFFSATIHYNYVPPIASGICGDNLTWVLDSDGMGILTISGTGAMYNYSDDNQPWSAYKELIKSVVLNNGITVVGSHAFSNCSSLTEAIIPSSVVSIAESVFAGCRSLVSITIPSGVSEIASYTFEDCTSLTSVTIFSGVTFIDKYAFKNCTSLSDIYYSGNKTQWDSIRIGTAGSGIPDSAVIHYSELPNLKGHFNQQSYTMWKEDLLFVDFSGEGDTYWVVWLDENEVYDTIYYPDTKQFKIYGSWYGVGEHTLKLFAYTWEGEMILMDTVPLIITEDAPEIEGHFLQRSYTVWTLDTLTIKFYGQGDAQWVVWLDEDEIFDTIYYTDSKQFTVYGPGYDVGEYTLKLFAYTTAGDMILMDTVPLTVSAETPDLHGQFTQRSYNVDTDGQISVEFTAQGETHWVVWLDEMEIFDTIYHPNTKQFDIYGSYYDLGEHTLKLFAYTWTGDMFEVDSVPLIVTSDKLDPPTGITLNENYVTAYIQNDVTTSFTWQPEGWQPKHDYTIRLFGTGDFWNHLKSQQIDYDTNTVTIAMDAPGEYQYTVNVLYGDYEFAEPVWLTITDGSNISWSYNNNTLIISGTGPMPDYDISDSEAEILAPWLEHRFTTQKIVIEDGVTSIGNAAFYNYPALTTVTMADSVTRIGNNVFEYCDHLSSIRFSANLTNIGMATFEGCTGLTSVTLPGSLKKLGYIAFADCSLTSVTVSGNAKAQHFFYSDDNGQHLYHINLPAGITEIGKGVFCNNPLPHDTPDFILPSNLTAIKAEAFSGTDVRFVWLPEGITSIGANAFANSQVKYVYIPYGCNSIGAGAFPAGTIILGDFNSEWDAGYARTWAEQNGCVFILLDSPFSGNG